jgi:MarR family transcriptional regulator, negative regulator of the multidrug operon emrRAB
MDDRTANLLGALATGIQDAVRDGLVGEAGMDRTAATALLAVRERPGQSIAQLATALSLTHSGADRSVDRLTRRGLITRGRGQDGRSRGLVLTPAGRVITGQLLAARRRLLLGLLDDLPPDERACFARAAKRLLAQLPASRADAWRICRTCDHDVCRGPACPVGSAVAAFGA